MPGLYHQCHNKGLHRGKGRKQHFHRHKFQGAAEDGHTHEQGVEKVETGYIHVDTVGYAQKPESCKDRNGRRESLAGGLSYLLSVLSGR